MTRPCWIQVYPKRTNFLILSAAEVFDADQEWVNQFLEIGRQPDEQQKPWYELLDLIDRCCKEIPEKEAPVLSHGPKIDSNRTDAENMKICQAIIEHLEAGKKLKGVLSFMHRDWTEFVESSQVDSGTARSNIWIRIHSGKTVSANILKRN
jgi:hypothetical protein